MVIIKQKSIVLFVLFIFSVVPVSSQDFEQRQPPVGLQKALPDLLLVRPVCVIGAIITTTAFLISLPYTYPTGKSAESCATLVERPWNYISNRPLGVFEPDRNMANLADEKISQQHNFFLKQTNADLGIEELR